MSHFLRTLSALAAGSCLAVGAAGANAADKGKDYFNGKTVEWIVSTAPGGGHDYWGRLLATNMRRFLPGSSFVVKNRPGAGHIIGANLVYNAKPDGLTVGNFSTGLAYSQLIRKKGIQFDLAKMSWLGKVTSERRVMSVGKNSEFKTLDDVINSKRPVKFSASGVGSGSFTDSFMIAAALNIPHKIINGYSGSQAALAIVRGEIDVLMGGEDSADTYMRAGHLRPIMMVGGKTKPGVANGLDYAKTPFAKSMLKLMSNMSELSRITAGPPAIPTDRLTALRTAFKEALESKELRAAAAKAQREIEPAYGEDVQKMVAELMDQPPEVVKLLKDLSEVKAETVKHDGKVTAVKNGGREIVLKYKGKDVGAKVSGSRTKLTLNGVSAKRSAIKAGMNCTFTYPGPGQEAQRIDCKN